MRRGDASGLASGLASDLASGFKVDAANLPPGRHQKDLIPCVVKHTRAKEIEEHGAGGKLVRRLVGAGARLDEPAILRQVGQKGPLVGTGGDDHTPATDRCSTGMAATRGTMCACYLGARLFMPGEGTRPAMDQG